MIPASTICNSFGFFYESFDVKLSTILTHPLHKPVNEVSHHFPVNPTLTFPNDQTTRIPEINNRDINSCEFKPEETEPKT
ncbi:hypothetical protein JTE90_029651 [Oedothorax gibbosus]|uniref:Uncharacterized protein n=1 Tax=Oedothorax gibbosus TaxID=931172 RepID=A0AAV6VEF1_9ARAC|nr:hypothetical protein JTE90_029651 [Oedothorax gibbosus]